MVTTRTEGHQSTRNSRGNCPVIVEARDQEPAALPSEAALFSHSVTQSAAQSGSENGQPAADIQDLGHQLDNYELRVQRLRSEVIDATSDKHELVDALRDLHGQFESL